MTIPTSTSLAQRIKSALSGSDLHSAEVIGLIEAANSAASRLENLIAQLNILLTAVLAAEKATQKPQPRDIKTYVIGSLADPNAPF